MSAPCAKLARIKAKGVKPAISANGGIDGAAATVDKGRSWVGEWNNVNTPESFPGMADQLLLDEVAIATSGRAPILQAIAAELGHVAIMLPDCTATDDRVVMSLAEATAEFGDVAGAVTEALRDGVRTERENAEIVLQIDEALAALSRMRLLVTGAAAVPVSAKEREES